MSSKTTILSGRDFTSTEINLVKDFVANFPKLSRKELAFTICENISWLRANGSHKVDSCLKAMEKLEKLGEITLPAKSAKRTPRKTIVPLTFRTEEHPIFTVELKNLGTLKLQIVSGKDERDLWNEFIQRYHYLQYAKPVGSHLRYFIVAPDLDNKILGCLLFSASAWSVKCRDQYIGWEASHREKFLHLVVNNSRFLILPWVKIPNLASHVLGLITSQIQDDWEKAFAFRPVLLETFVESERYTGGCYKAANWTCVGETLGMHRKDRLLNHIPGVKKKLFLYPLEANYKNYLTGKEIFKKKSKPKISSIKKSRIAHSPPDENFLELWKSIVNIVTDVAQSYDDKWRIRKRVINSLILVLLILRLVSSQRRGYTINISELWENCKDIGICLPQKNPISASSFSDARLKMNPNIFKAINSKIIEEHEKSKGEEYLWKGCRLFAIDGTKIYTPRTFFASGYKSASANKHYPQAIVSSLFQVKSKLPFDFEMSSHLDERALVHEQIAKLRKNDIVVYDRGYFSYQILFTHLSMQTDAIFRLPKGLCKVFDNFIESNETDSSVELSLFNNSKNKRLRQKFPNIETPKMRLVKYKIDETEYVLGTTLYSPSFTVEDLSNAYHARWGVEELYKISKNIFNVEEFHSQSEYGVKQEVYAHFVMITLNRIFANESNSAIANEYSKIANSQPTNEWLTNFRTCVAATSRRLEQLFLSAGFVIETVKKLFSVIVQSYSKQRPNRKYQRVSMKPENKWRKRLPEEAYAT